MDRIGVRQAVGVGLRATTIATDASDRLYVAGLLSGCADLGSAATPLSVCARTANAGFRSALAEDPESDPHLLFVNRYARDGAYTGTQLFQGHPLGTLAISPSGNMAFAAIWEDKRPLRLKTPLGVRMTVGGAKGGDFKAFLLLYSTDGKVLAKHEFDSQWFARVADVAFDSHDVLWFLLISSGGRPLVDGSSSPPATVGSRQEAKTCRDRLALWSMGPSGQLRERWSACTQVKEEAPSVALAISRDDRLAVANLSGMAFAALRSGRAGLPPSPYWLALLTRGGEIGAAVPRSTRAVALLPGNRACYDDGPSIVCRVIDDEEQR
ncbi:MAG: hypothetical protein ABJA82_08740 [Myxococcales bacterium]